MRKIVMLVVCSTVATLFVLLWFNPSARAQSLPGTNAGSQAKDPGVRAGFVNAGPALSTLSPSQVQFFTDGQTRFSQVDQVAAQLLTPTVVPVATHSLRGRH